jgi:hypothetical protein
MILARGTEHVGSWHFRLSPDDSDEGMIATSSRCLRALRKMEEICHASAREGLVLFPLQVKVFFGVGPSYPPTRVVEVSSEEELRAAMLSLVQSGGDFDWDLEVLAQSSVLSVSGQRWQKDVFGVDCAFTGASITVTAWTRADIWMPYNLMAQSQWEVAELNAPRLRAALEAIEQIVGQARLRRGLALREGRRLRAAEPHRARRRPGSPGHGLRRVVDRGPLARARPAGSAARAGGRVTQASSNGSQLVPTGISVVAKKPKAP